MNTHPLSPLILALLLSCNVTPLHANGSNGGSGNGGIGTAIVGVVCLAIGWSARYGQNYYNKQTEEKYREGLIIRTKALMEHAASLMNMLTGEAAQRPVERILQLSYNSHELKQYTQKVIDARDRARMLLKEINEAPYIAPQDRSDKEQQFQEARGELIKELGKLEQALTDEAGHLERFNKERTTPLATLSTTLNKVEPFIACNRNNAQDLKQCIATYWSDKLTDHGYPGHPATAALHENIRLSSGLEGSLRTLSNQPFQGDAQLATALEAGRVALQELIKFREHLTHSETHKRELEQYLHDLDLYEKAFAHRAQADTKLYEEKNRATRLQMRQDKINREEAARSHQRQQEAFKAERELAEKLAHKDCKELDQKRLCEIHKLESEIQDSKNLIRQAQDKERQTHSEHKKVTKEYKEFKAKGSSLATQLTVVNGNIHRNEQVPQSDKDELATISKHLNELCPPLIRVPLHPVLPEQPTTSPPTGAGSTPFKM